MVLVRSSAVFLWHAEKPDELIAVIPPSTRDPTRCREPPMLPGVRATRGAEAPALRIRTAQLSPLG